MTLESTKGSVLPRAPSSRLCFTASLCSRYCTAAHTRLVHQHGPSPVHRRSFDPVKSYLARHEPQASSEGDAEEVTTSKQKRSRSRKQEASKSASTQRQQGAQPRKAAAATRKRARSSTKVASAPPSPSEDTQPESFLRRSSRLQKK